MSDMIKSTVVNSMGYGIVPKLVMKDKIDIAAKGLYAYFCSYAGAGNTCFPPRDLICSDLGISKDRFTKLLKQLTDKGYIKIEQVKDGGRFAHNVYTIVADTLSPPCPVFPDTVKPDTEIPDTVFPDTENTDINNNSINNNSINNSKYIDKENLPIQLKEFSKLYEQNIGLINGVAAEYLIELSETIDVSLFKRAIEIATDKGKCNLGYIKGIIKQWLDLNIKTLKQLEAYKLQQENFKSKGVKPDVRRRKRDIETKSSEDDRESEEARRAELLRKIRELDK